MQTSSNTPAVVLRSGGTAVLVDVAGPGLPRVLHWGADLDLPARSLPAVVDALEPGVPRGALDAPWPLTVLPGAADGWPGRATVRGHRRGETSVGAAAFPRWTTTSVAASTDAVRVVAGDTGLGLELTCALVLEPSGVLVVEVTLSNSGEGEYVLDGITPVLPVPPRAREMLDLAGRWGREHSPQRSPLNVGIRARESWRGRPGHDGTPLLVAGTPGFGFGHGEVWGVHVACGGNAVHIVERVPEGFAVLGGGELAEPGELVLAPGETYAAPTLLAAWSDTGLDGLSARLHGHVRTRVGHPSSPRPLTLNVWEAVYFDHDLDRLKGLADRAAALGVERFVLDDGWFLGRRDDTRGLGDWVVDPVVWPDGLHPLVQHVRGLGMQFGLWFEPEMISLDSDVARAHPDWVLAAPDRLPRAYRHQHVIDLANPDAFVHVLGQIDALCTEYALDAIKWDHNRDLSEPVHAGRPGVHAQTEALHRLLDELRSRHPGLEIESCASGGGRADLATLARTERIWGSDCTDPVERQAIQRWTGLLLPPELVGAHVGAPVSHTTGRASDLSFRLVTSLFGHAGIEWDITTCSDDELDRLRTWAGLYKQLRGVLHSGVTVRADDVGEGALLHGVVAGDEAVYAYVRLATTVDAIPPRLLLPGLDPARTYRVRASTEVGDVGASGRSQTPWLEKGVELPGAVLAHIGLAAPLLNPDQAVLLHVVAVA
ncbi:alpha-galactosidase [Pseudonocardia sp.]|uniref:alpha-galactosidase n=1 Tax=Pseudonocardia sp. TaxID=60912 RepID=UPI00262F7A1A|nr:alpha-galactosidase [Pseudonocardia sp.]MCW2721475.1 alpha-galactosidase [Pseudonocardia sp.]